MVCQPIIMQQFHVLHRNYSEHSLSLSLSLSHSLSLSISLSLPSHTHTHVHTHYFHNPCKPRRFSNSFPTLFYTTNLIFTLLTSTILHFPPFIFTPRTQTILTYPRQFWHEGTPPQLGHNVLVSPV